MCPPTCCPASDSSSPAETVPLAAHLRMVALANENASVITLASLVYSTRASDDGRHPSKFLVDRDALRRLGDAIARATEAKDAALKAALDALPKGGAT